MTGPGPQTPPPPPRPGRSYHDAGTAMDAAAVAGSYGCSAWPLDERDRIDNYWRQNGHAKGLTPRQRRRAEHKACRAFYRGDKTSANNGPGAGAAGIDVTAAPAHAAA